ncbi:MAG: FAD-dependent oxidoreductase [Clostridia bacterium]|nr:FAD-dependent oxidoreductase [Clostridia bacterium]
MKEYELVIIGGGPAGLAAAVAARKAGIQDILILERDNELGGILNQCIHNGFGLHTFKEELTGPEYAGRFIAQVEELGIPYKLNTMVMDLAADKTVTAMNREDGLFQLHPKAVILAMGCRERPRGALSIPGYRPAGIYTAGTAQRLVNMEGFMPGRKVVILGSGDIGLIMARRMTLEGAEVKVVAELMPYSGGLKRNIVQCLDDYGIPLKLSHTVVDIKGKKRVEGITLAQVDGFKPIPGTEEFYECDTLLLSCGLIPENELSRSADVELSPLTNGPLVGEDLQTNIPGIFAAGNVLHVHDLVDFVSEEAGAAGRHAAAYIQNGCKSEDAKELKVVCEGGVRYSVPVRICPDHLADDALVTLRFRVANVYKNKKIVVYAGEDVIFSKKRPVLAPGEMETVILKAKVLKSYSELDHITVTLEEA